MFTLDELHSAVSLVRTVMPPTPERPWPLLGRRVGAEVWVKHENHAPTGAFKVRGGIVYLDRLKRERPHVPGLVTATRGNHGQSLAFASARQAVPITILVPRGNSVEKNAAMEAFGGKLIEHGDDFQAAREEAIRLANAQNLEMVPSFCRDLILGVATYAFELFTSAPDLKTLYVPIGLGSGICGCILVRDLLGLKTEIVGVQSTEAASYARSLEAGRIVSTATSNTRADGMATRIPDAEAFAIIQRGVTRIVEVTDDEIADAIRAYWTDTHNLAEGAGAAALAALIQERDEQAGCKVGVVLSGGNIDLNLFRDWVLGE